MVIFVNDEASDVSKNTFLSDLVEDLKFNTLGLALAVNNAVVPQCDWTSTQLNENDKVLIISATKGG